MANVASKLKNTLEEISRDTWNLLGDSKNFKTSFNEEALTNLLAVKFMRGNFSTITIDQTTHGQEAVQGNDILIEGWLGPFEDHWMRLAIQAKKLNYQSGRYDELDYKSPKRNLSQLKTLEQYAHKNKAIAMYLLYNYDDAPNSIHHWNCCSRPMRRKQLGCTITPSATIQRAIDEKRNRFNEIHESPSTIPLRCLALCESKKLSDRMAPAPQEFQLPLPQTTRWYELPEILSTRNLESLTPEQMFGARDEYGSRLYDQGAGLPILILIGDRSIQEAMPNEERL